MNRKHIHRLAALISESYEGLEDADEFGQNNHCSNCGWEDDENRRGLYWCAQCVDTRPNAVNKICPKCDSDLVNWYGRPDGNPPRITETGWWTNGRGDHLCPEHNIPEIQARFRPDPSETTFVSDPELYEGLESDNTFVESYEDLEDNDEFSEAGPFIGYHIHEMVRRATEFVRNNGIDVHFRDDGNGPHYGQYTWATLQAEPDELYPKAVDLISRVGTRPTLLSPLGVPSDMVADYIVDLGGGYSLMLTYEDPDEFWGPAIWALWRA